MITRLRSNKKETGGKYTAGRTKKLVEIGRLPTNTKVGETKRKAERVRGGIVKQRLLEVNTINLFDGKNYVKATVKMVSDSEANRNFVRRNIITKGAIVETDKGKAKITSRPGQTGTLNAVLVKE